jgi:hypothetical protein
MIEFTNPGGSEMDQIIGLQNAVNKSWLDVIAAADAEGFPITVASYTGDKSPPPPPDDPTKALPVGPGRWVEVDGGTVQRLDGANLDPMLNVVWALVQAISGVSRTPQYYLKPVGGSDVPSGEALKQLDSGLVKRAEERQLIFGQTWTDVMAMCVKVNATFGTTSTPDLDRIDIATTWDSAQTRYELAAAQTALIYKQLGMPDDYVWSSTGAQPEQIASWKDQKRMDQAADIATLTQSLKAAGTTLAPAPPNQNVNPIPAPTNGSTNGTQNGVL